MEDGRIVTIDVSGTFQLKPKSCMADGSDPTRRELIAALKKLPEEYLSSTEFLEEWSIRPDVEIIVDGKKVATIPGD